MIYCTVKTSRRTCFRDQSLGFPFFHSFLLVCIYKYNNIFSICIYNKHGATYSMRWSQRNRGVFFSFNLYKYKNIIKIRVKFEVKLLTPISIDLW